MQKIKYFLFIIVLTSCNENKISFRQEIGNDGILSVYVDNLPEFGYHFSNTPVLFQNDEYKTFEEIDSEIFDYLQLNTKNFYTCNFFVKIENKDQYGHTQGSYERWQNVDLYELKKYQNSTYWSLHTCGVKFIKYGECK